LGLISLLIRNSHEPGHQMAFKLTFCSLLILFGVMVWFRIEYLRDYKMTDYKKQHIQLKVLAFIFFLLGLYSLF
jgi:threonine/homoserine/homoserine lactone efflux protein